MLHPPRAGDVLPRLVVTPGWWPLWLLHASTAACSGHKMHTDTSLCPELTAFLVSEVQRCVFPSH